MTDDPRPGFNAGTAEEPLSMRAALEQIIEMNRDYARDRWGSAEQAESMSCVRVARAALAAPKAEAWQPIETAPKDGTWVLLYTASGIVEGCWSCGGWVNGPIYCTYDGAGGPAFEASPTHWMHLPAPPAHQGATHE